MNPNSLKAKPPFLLFTSLDLCGEQHYTNPASIGLYRMVATISMGSIYLFLDYFDFVWFASMSPCVIFRFVHTSTFLALQNSLLPQAETPSI